MIHNKTTFEKLVNSKKRFTDPWLDIPEGYEDLTLEKRLLQKTWEIRALVDAYRPTGGIRFEESFKAAWGRLHPAQDYAQRASGLIGRFALYHRFSESGIITSEGAQYLVILEYPILIVSQQPIDEQQMIRDALSRAVSTTYGLLLRKSQLRC